MTTRALCCLLLSLAVSPVMGEERHRVYAGPHWTHLSNVDSGPPFNNNYEDDADHLGVDVEYQYHSAPDQYFFMSVGVGYSRVNTKNQSGWDCSGCKLPSTLRLGYKWRIY